MINLFGYFLDRDHHDMENREGTPMEESSYCSSSVLPGKYQIKTKTFLFVVLISVCKHHNHDQHLRHYRRFRFVI